MANTGEPVVHVVCPYCKRRLENDANIVLGHIQVCCVSWSITNFVAIPDSLILNIQLVVRNE